jgi:hypothetical protein
VELSGLNRRATPLLAGKVTFVSPDLNSDPSAPATKFFIARVSLDSHQAAGIELSPGMPIVAYIKTRERSPIELWLDPIIGALRHSMRER